MTTRGSHRRSAEEYHRNRFAANGKTGRVSGPFSSLTKEEKTRFFLLCGHQPKINKLIFPVCYPQLFANPAMA